MCVAVTKVSRCSSRERNSHKEKQKKDNRVDCPFRGHGERIRGPYRDRTGDLHNAIVALSHAELTARMKYTCGDYFGAKLSNTVQQTNIPIHRPKVNER